MRWNVTLETSARVSCCSGSAAAGQARVTTDSRDLGAMASGCRAGKGCGCLGGTLLAQACCSTLPAVPPTRGEDFSGFRSPHCIPGSRPWAVRCTACLSPLISQDGPPQWPL